MVSPRRDGAGDRILANSTDALHPAPPPPECWKCSGSGTYTRVVDIGRDEKLTCGVCSGTGRAEELPF